MDNIIKSAVDRLRAINTGSTGFSWETKSDQPRDERGRFASSGSASGATTHESAEQDDKPTWMGRGGKQSGSLSQNPNVLTHARESGVSATIFAGSDPDVDKTTIGPQQAAAARTWTHSNMQGTPDQVADKVVAGTGLRHATEVGHLEDGGENSIGRTVTMKIGLHKDGKDMGAIHLEVHSGGIHVAKVDSPKATQLLENVGKIGVAAKTPVTASHDNYNVHPSDVPDSYTHSNRTGPHMEGGGWGHWTHTAAREAYRSEVAAQEATLRSGGKSIIEQGASKLEAMLKPQADLAQELKGLRDLFKKPIV